MVDVLKELLQTNMSHPFAFEQVWKWLRYPDEASAKKRLLDPKIAQETRNGYGSPPTLMISADGVRLLAIGANDGAHARAVAKDIMHVQTEVVREQAAEYQLLRQSTITDFEKFHVVQKQYSINFEEKYLQPDSTKATAVARCRARKNAIKMLQSYKLDNEFRVVSVRHNATKHMRKTIMITPYGLKQFAALAGWTTPCSH